MNFLNNIKKVVTESKKKSPNTAFRFSNVIIRKDKKTLEELLADTASLKIIVFNKILA